MTDKWYDKSVKQIEAKLGTDLRLGLSNKNALERSKKFGANMIYPIPKGSFISYLKNIVTDFTSILLILTAVISAVFEQEAVSAVIIVLIVINYSTAIFTYVKSQRVLEGMGHYALPAAKVMRDGRLFLVRQEQLVPGDVIFISAGDIVPCDARLVESDGLSALEVNLTMAPRASHKSAEFIEFRDIPPSEQLNMVFASTILISGTAKAIVCETGENTLVSTLGKNTPIVTHEKLAVLATLRKYCAAWSLCMIGVIFVLTVLDIVLGIADGGIYSRGLYDIFITGLSLAVASMSEFYMAFGYTVIACGVFNSAQQNASPFSKENVNSGALIKNSACLEILKDITCLIVPKEGVFSMRDLQIQRIYANGVVYAADDRGFVQNSRNVLKYAIITTALYGGAKLIDNNLKNENIYTAEEDAIISLADKCSLYNVELDKNYPIVNHSSVSDEIPFESTLVDNMGVKVLTIRGSVSKILEVCRYYTENGRVYTLTSEKINEIKITADLIIKQAYRVIGVAEKTVASERLSILSSDMTGFVFEGFMAICEPLLHGAAKNVSKCRAAGIKVIMLCDDVSENNRFLAEAVGVAENVTDIITSDELKELNAGLFKTNIADGFYTVYEGLNITQKRLLLSTLHENGEKVGVLAKELDEVILLKEADVGFAQSMTLSRKAFSPRRTPIYTRTSKDSSKSGCEALKFISDVIISFANKVSTHGYSHGGFNAIIDAVSYAKVIYINFIRVIKYLLTVQSARLFVILYSVVTGMTLFTPIQILFSGMIIDLMSVIIIAFERPSTDILTQNVKTEDTLKNPLLHNIQSILFGLFFALLVVAGGYILPLSDELRSSYAFTAFILTQIITLNETMKERSIFIPNVKFNRAYVVVVAGIALFVSLCILLPTLGRLFGIVPMGAAVWGMSIGTAAVMLAVFELYKMLMNGSKTKK